MRVCVPLLPERVRQTVREGEWSCCWSHDACDCGDEVQDLSTFSESSSSIKIDGSFFNCGCDCDCDCDCVLSLFFTLNEWIINYELIGSMLVSMRRRRRNWIELNIENQRERESQERMATTTQKGRVKSQFPDHTILFFFLQLNRFLCLRQHLTHPLPDLTYTYIVPLLIFFLFV
jgi:hypothetical protein